MLSRVKNILKNSWQELLIIVSIGIILLSAFLFNLQSNKKVVSNKVVSKNKKLFTTEYNREFIGDNERIIIVKNEDIINHKVIFDLNDSKIARIKIIPLSNEILKDLSIKLYVYHNNKEYVITNNNFVNNILEYKMFETNNERVEIKYTDDPNINSLKEEDLILIRIIYGNAEWIVTKL